VITAVVFVVLGVLMVDWFGLPGLFATLLLMSALGAVLKHILKKHFDPMLIYEAEDRARRGH